MKLTAPFLAIALALTTFACASTTDDANSSDSDITAASGGACGTGLSGIAISCNTKEFCDFPATENGAADTMGTCKARPEICPALVAPVCGRDGKTYNNSCEANKGGTSVDHASACEVAQPKPCGTGVSGIAISCGTSEYCDLGAASPGGGDQMGECKARPQICPALVSPVCGSDGKTYNNSCEANRAGKSVAKSGACH